MERRPTDDLRRHRRRARTGPALTGRDDARRERALRREGRAMERGDRPRRLERLVRREVHEALRAARRRKRARHGSLELGRLQRQVARLGGTMRIVIEIPDRPARPARTHRHPLRHGRRFRPLAR